MPCVSLCELGSAVLAVVRLCGAVGSTVLTHPLVVLGAHAASACVVVAPLNVAGVDDVGNLIHLCSP